MTRAAQLTIDLVADLRKLREQFDQASTNVQKFGATMRNALGAVGIGVGLTSLLNQFRQVADAISELGDRIVRTGVASEELQRLEFAAIKAGVSVEELAGAFDRMNRLVSEAFQGQESAIAIFDRLGISITDTSGKLRSSNEIFRDVADVVSRIESPTERAGVLMEIFGRSGARMAPLMFEGARGIDAVGNSLRATFTEEQTAVVKEFADNLGGVAYEITRLAASPIAWVAERLNAIGQAMGIFSTPPRGLEEIRESITSMSAEADILNQRWIELNELLTKPPSQRPVALTQQISNVENRLAFLNERITKDEDELRRRTPGAVPPPTARPAPPTTPGTGGGGGARTVREQTREIDEQADALKRYREETERMSDPFRAAADPAYRLRQEMEQLNTAFERGGLTQEEYDKNLERIRKQMESLNKETDDLSSIFTAANEEILQFGETMASGLVDALTGAEASFSRFVTNILKRLADMVAYLLIVKPILNSLFGASGLVTGLFGGADGGVKTASIQLAGARAAGGRVRAGSAYRVGEFRPETFIPDSNGVIAPGTIGNTQVNVYNETNGRARVEEEATPDGKRINVYIENVVEQAMASGRFDRTLSAGFGMRRMGAR